MLSDNAPSIRLLIDSAMRTMENYVSRKPEAVIGVEGSDKGWTVTVEAIERKTVPDTQDILGRYEIRLSEQGKVLGWKRVMVRRRSDHYNEKGS